MGSNSIAILPLSYRYIPGTGAKLATKRLERAELKHMG